jgi:hypothetical protein
LYGVECNSLRLTLYAKDRLEKHPDTINCIAR